MFTNESTVTDYFKKFNVPLVALPASLPAEKYVNFATGKLATKFTPPSDIAVGEAFEKYLGIIEQYPDLQTGFNMTYPVAPDLLLPFGEFVQKYNLSAMMPTVFAVCQGYSSLLDMTTLYMFKYLNLSLLKTFLGGGYLTTLHHDISQLYLNAGKFLAPDVYLSSHVVAMNRTCDPIRICVQTPSGYKLILAKKLISSIPPVLSNLGGYDLSTSETSLFGQFFGSGYYTGVLNNTSLPQTASLANIDAGMPDNIPHLPAAYSFEPSPATNLTQVYYGSPSIQSSRQVKSEIFATLKRVQKGLNVPTSKADFVIFSNHAPFNLRVSTDAIKDKFYEKLFALQGERNTYYTGAAWQTQASNVLWEFSQNWLLPRVVASL